MPDASGCEQRGVYMYAHEAPDVSNRPGRWYPVAEADLIERVVAAAAAYDDLVRRAPEMFEAPDFESAMEAVIEANAALATYRSQHG